MHTRRQFVFRAAAAATAMPLQNLNAKPSQPATRVQFPVPRNACDCHTHIFGDPAQFPMSPGRSYTPEMAGPEEMSALHRALKIDRVVIVTPSVYGTDNAATLYGIKARGKSARGIAVVDLAAPAKELDALERGGIRGIRINAATGPRTTPEQVRQRLQSAIALLKGRGWHIQMYTDAASIPAIRSVVLESPVPVVFDHFGGALTEAGLKQPGFAELLELVRSGKAYVKISCAYRASTQAPEYPDVAPFAHALIAANPDRILWGTDWPHPNSSSKKPLEVTPLLAIDDGLLLNQLLVWAPDPAVRKRILVENPERLYGF